MTQPKSLSTSRATGMERQAIYWEKVNLTRPLGWDDNTKMNFKQLIHGD